MKVLSNIYIPNLSISNKKISLVNQNKIQSFSNTETCQNDIFQRKSEINELLIDNIAQTIGLPKEENTFLSLKNINDAIINMNKRIIEMATMLNIDKSSIKDNNILSNLSLVQKHLGIDYKSGLYNAETLKKDIEIQKQECAKTGKPLSFVMFDFDNFKSVNDLLSYDIGDEFIKSTGTDIGRIADKYKVKAYRFGGEEFMIILPGYTKDEAAEIAQETLNIVNNEYVTDKYLNQYITNGERIKSIFRERQKLFLDVTQTIDAVKDTDDEALKEGLKEKSIKLLEKAKEDLPTSEEKEKAEYYIKKVQDGESFAELYENDSVLKYTLIALYNGQDKINTIDKWISSVTLRNENNKPRGFTMTSGVWQAEDLTKSPDEYIHSVGEVLSYGKRRTKGNVYCKTDKYCERYQPNKFK